MKRALDHVSVAKSRSTTFSELVQLKAPRSIT